MKSQASLKVEERQNRVKERNRTMKEGSEKCNVAAFKNEGSRLWDKECEWSLEDRKGKEMNSSLEPLENKHSPTNILILAQRYSYQTFNLQNYKIIMF